MLKRTFGLLIALTLTLATHAVEPRPIPAKKWQFDCHRILSAAARANTTGDPNALATALADCLPARPVEFRYAIQTLTYRDGILKLTCSPPLGWIKDRDGVYPTIHAEHIFYVTATPAEAATIRSGAHVTVIHTIEFELDYQTWLTERRKTTTLVARLATSGRDTAHAIARTSTLTIGKTHFAIDHRAGF